MAGADDDKISVLSGRWPGNELPEQGAPLGSDIRPLTHLVLVLHICEMGNNLPPPCCEESKTPAPGMSDEPPAGSHHCPSKAVLKFDNRLKLLSS